MEKHEVRVGDRIRWSEPGRGGYARFAGEVLEVLAGMEEFKIRLTRCGGVAPARLKVDDIVITGFGGGKPSLATA